MIVGIGVDVVPVSRFAEALARTPALADRLFTPTERLTKHGEPRTDDAGRPSLRVVGTVRARAEALGVTSWHVSLSHDGGIASAVVVAETRPG